MLPTIRSRAARQISRGLQYSARQGYAFSANDQQEINAPKPQKEVQNVSETNEMPMDAIHTSAALQESVEHAEKRRVTQAPNRDQVWSRSQNPRAKAMSGPRFEQTIMELQVC
jgi:NADH dehydrogenase (ubiquinone) Fe-S protein 6